MPESGGPAIRVPVARDGPAAVATPALTVPLCIEQKSLCPGGSQRRTGWRHVEVTLAFLETPPPNTPRGRESCAAESGQRLPGGRCSVNIYSVRYLCKCVSGVKNRVVFIKNENKRSYYKN